MKQITAFKRPSDGEVFSINDDGSFSLEFIKKEYPDSMPIKHTKETLLKHKFIPLYQNMNTPKNKLILIAGPSGSGKSTKAKKLAPENCICEADKFWINCTGEYLFVPSLLGKAHSWCQNEVERLMKEDKSRIVVSNTSLTEKERNPYKMLAEKYDYEYEVEFPDSPWFCSVRPRLIDKTFTDDDVNLFVNKSTHGVPFEGIKRMFQKYSET
jgi:predicted kinase